MLFIKSIGQLASSLLIKHDASTRLIARQFEQNLFNTTKRLLASGNGESNIIKIDDSCLKRFEQVLSKPKQEFLRINVETGGCSGFSYVFDIEDEKQIQPGEDLIVERDSYRVVVSKDILPFIQGSTLEYHESLIKSSFQVVNPIAESKCSCGSSFSVDLSKLQKSNAKEQEQSE